LADVGWFGKEALFPGQLSQAERQENREAKLERIRSLEEEISYGLRDPEEIRDEINKLKEELGMPTEEPVGIRGPMDLK
jgi:hypothetical protein